nr:13405_t:CDS:10 [Entrophospora candida]
MLDRYSQKDKDLKTLQIDDIVLTTIKPDPRFPSRGVGKIINQFNSPNGTSFWVIEVEEEFENNIDLNLLYQNHKRQIIKQIHEIEKPQIRDFKIIPAGRVLHGAGSQSAVTYFNCYVMPYIPDSRQKIARHREEVMEIMSRGGGVGSNGSTLRPRGAVVKQLTHLVEQGGSRRGAQMIMLADWHPDIIEFIVSKVQNPRALLKVLDNTENDLIKKEINQKLEKKGDNYQVRNTEFLSGANISVCISDKFMEAPTMKNGMRSEMPMNEKKKVMNRANNFTNARGYGQKVVATNPCGEQPLAPYSDNVIDASYYFPIKGEKDTTLKDQAQGERRIGMGVMGLHDFLIYAGKKYGSEEANSLVDKLFETVCNTAYESSIELAQEKGVFPFLKDRNEFVNKSGFIQTLPKYIQGKIREHGLRNSHLLTVAPTGSTGTLVGVSTGLEPYFAFSHYRSGRLGELIKVEYPIVKEWLKYHPEHSSEKLPDIFISAMDEELKPEAHTVNAPRGYSEEQVKKIYENLYEKGAKGGTVYVDGSRDFQVLSLEKSDNQFSDLENKKENQKERLKKIGIEDYDYYYLQDLKQILFCEDKANELPEIKNSLSYKGIKKITFFTPLYNEAISYRPSYVSEIEDDIIVKKVYNASEAEDVYVSRNPDNYLLPLDVIRKERDWYSHFAVYLGGSSASLGYSSGSFASGISSSSLGLGSLASGSFVSSGISSSSALSNSSNSSSWNNNYVFPFANALFPTEKKNYNASYRNCEHFANRIVFGINISKQVSDALDNRRSFNLKDEVSTGGASCHSPSFRNLTSSDCSYETNRIERYAQEAENNRSYTRPKYRIEYEKFEE